MTNDFLEKHKQEIEDIEKGYNDDLFQYNDLIKLLSDNGIHTFEDLNKLLSLSTVLLELETEKTKNKDNLFAINILKQELSLYKEALELAVKDTSWRCPNPPEEPYYISEGGYEIDDSSECLKCQLTRYLDKAKKNLQKKL